MLKSFLLRPEPLVYRARIWGTSITLVVTDPRVLVDAVRVMYRELERIDRATSRFRSGAEIHELHHWAGEPVAVSDDLWDAIVEAIRMAEATDGAVDPTVGEAMRRLGYDRDFAAVAGGASGPFPARQPVPGWRSVELDAMNRTVRLAPGTRLDLGATAKALAADRVARGVLALVGCGVEVSLGGDVAVAGPPPEQGFQVGIADTCDANEIAETVAVASGGLATSGLAARHWKLDGHEVHHIVDPDTGLPAAAVWRTVSVTAASCVEANAASTAAIVKGNAALAWLSARQLPSRLVAMDGSIRRVAGWPDTDADKEARETTVREGRLP